MKQPILFKFSKSYTQYVVSKMYVTICIMVLLFHFSFTLFFLFFWSCLYSSSEEGRVLSSPVRSLWLNILIKFLLNIDGQHPPSKREAFCLFCFFNFLKYLLIILLQFSHFYPFTQLHPAHLLPPTFPPYSSCPWVILIGSLASTFPTLFLPTPVYFPPIIYATYSLYLPPLPLPLP